MKILGEMEEKDAVERLLNSYMKEKPVTFSVEEKAYLLSLLTEPLNYYQTLAARANCSEHNQEWCELLESLWGKLK